MPRRRHLLPLVAALLLTATGRTETAAETESTRNPASSAPPARARALSADLAHALTDSLPKYSPPPIKESNPADSDADAPTDDELFADLPQPKNGIVRLPRVVVEGERPPVFSEREIHTPKGLADLAVKRYFRSDTILALNRFRLPLIGMGKEAYAMMLYEQDERIRLLDEYGTDADLIQALGDDERAAALRDLVYETFSHDPLFLSPAHAPYRDARGQ